MDNIDTIKVFGHRSPDTDTTVGAIVWSWFLNNHRKQKAFPYTLGTLNMETRFVLNYWKVPHPEIINHIDKEDQVAIIDTNNLDELFENINETTIISIIDHHKLSGNLKTSHPPEIVIQPYASSMTVMYNIMNIEVGDFPQEIAGLMLSGIVSDTLKFRSPTTTDEDIALAKKLSSVLNINIDEYAKNMFDAKSNISEFSNEELLLMDSKIYDIKGVSTRISVLETTNPSIIIDRYDDLVSEMPDRIKEDGVDQILFFAIDILKEESIMFIPDKKTKDIAEESFNVRVSGKTVILPGFISRKKQLLPSLLGCYDSCCKK